MLYKILKVTIGLLFIIILSIYTFGEIPSYTIIVELKNKNIKIDEKLNYSIYAKGGGFCSKAYYSVSTEGVLISENYVIAGSINQSTPNPLIVEGQTTQYCYQQGKVISENIIQIVPSEAGQIRTEVLDLFNKSGFIELHNIGTMKPRTNSKSGQYSMNVVLSCLNNGQWYNFYSKENFRVLAKGEEEQFITARKAFLVALLALLFSLFLSDKTKDKIFQRLKK